MNKNIKLETWHYVLFHKDTLHLQTNYTAYENGRTLVDDSGDVWLCVDDDGYYFKYQRIAGQEFDLDKSVVN